MFNNVPYNKKFISKKIARKLEKEATEKFMRDIIELNDIPEYVRRLEERAKENGFTFDPPMKNEQFRELARKELGDEKSKDPLEVNNVAEKIKTKYVNHFNEYMKKKSELQNMNDIVKQYEDQIEFMKNRKPNIFQRIKSFLGI